MSVQSSAVAVAVALQLQFSSSLHLIEWRHISLDDMAVIRHDIVFIIDIHFPLSQGFREAIVNIFPSIIGKGKKKSDEF